MSEDLTRTLVHLPDTLPFDQYTALTDAIATEHALRHIRKVPDGTAVPVDQALANWQAVASNEEIHAGIARYQRGFFDRRMLSSSAADIVEGIRMQVVELVPRLTEAFSTTRWTFPYATVNDPTPADDAIPKMDAQVSVKRGKKTTVYVEAAKSDLHKVPVGRIGSRESSLLDEGRGVFSAKITYKQQPHAPGFAASGVHICVVTNTYDAAWLTDTLWSSQKHLGAFIEKDLRNYVEGGKLPPTRFYAAVLLPTILEQAVAHTEDIVGTLKKRLEATTTAAQTYLR